MPRSWLAAPVVAALVSGAFALPASATPQDRGPAASSSADATDRYLVRYAPGTDLAAAARSLRSQDVAVGRTFGHAVKAAVVTTTPGKAAALAHSPKVKSVEVDALVRVSTQGAAPWGLDRTDQRALPLSTTFTPAASGAGVDAYVVDTGVLAGHAELRGRVARGFSAIGDGRGSSDCNGHGTHVAGTVAGTTYGVAKAATVVPVRVLGCEGHGYLSDVVAGINWVVAQHTAGRPAVMNLSLGAGASTTIDAAVTGAIGDGITVAVAAGNSAANACAASPARVPGAITVAASDAADRQATFSNHGSCVDLYAPGVSITSAYHTSSTAAARMSGTSMAAPHVAGAAAVLLSRSPTLAPGRVAARLTNSATTGALRGLTTGTPNRLLFLARPATRTRSATAPRPATSLAARPRSRAARLTWVRGGNGGPPLTKQAVIVYKGKQRLRTIEVPVSASAVRVARLRPGHSYTFRVLKANEVGRRVSVRSNRVVPRR